MNRRYFQRQSSMNNWYPVLENMENVNTPETEKIELKGHEEDEDVPARWDNEEVKNAIEELGGAPVFARTDQASNKHFMHKSSKLPSKEDDVIDKHIREVIFHNVSAGWAGLPFDTLYLREWLDLMHSFKAFGQTPIAQELRFFIHDGEVLNHHFYWPKDSIKFFSHADTEEPDNWETLWHNTKKETLDKVHEPEYQAELVAEKLRGQGFWSLDFARTESGKWYAIDMAKGEISWHPRIDEIEKPITKLDDYIELYGLL